MYRRTKFDKLAKRWKEELGFLTSASTRPVLLSRLHKFVSRGMLIINDERMKAEMNTFVYNKTGRPEADKRKHDDMIFAWALALAGVDQIDSVRDEKLLRRPETLREMLAYEHATGKVFDKEWTDGEQGSLDIFSQKQFTQKRGHPAKLPGR